MAVIKHHDRGNLQKTEFIFGSQFHMVGVHNDRLKQQAAEMVAGLKAEG